MANKTAEGPKLARMKPKHVATLDDEPPGTVCVVRDTGDFDRMYALKTVERAEPEDDQAIARMRATFEAAGKLNHRALVALHDFRVKKALFRTVGAELLMEWVEGKSLDQLDTTTVAVGAWVQIAREVAAALAQMHRRKIQHGDLTPGKVVVSKGGRVKLLGYGQSLAPAAASAGARSRAYLAPERIKGEPPSEAADVYGLGALLYRCLIGQSANVGKRAEGEAEKISIPSALNPKVPAALNNLVVSCLQRQVARRPASAYDVQTALDAIAETMGVDDEALAGLGASEEKA